MTSLPSPSKFALASACAFPWSRHAPRKWPKRPRSPDAAFGTAISHVAECATAWGAAPVAEIAEANGLTPADARRLAICAEHVVDALEREAPRVTWRKAEIALAYHVERGTAREMRKDAPRDYSDARPGEVSGSLDLVQVLDGQLVVRDWKSGHKQARDTSIATDPQLRAYGLFAARAYGVDEVVVELAHVDESGIRYDSAHLDGFDLELADAELRALVRGVERAEVPAPGRHCREMWCPIVAVCPATKAALAAIDTAAASPYPLSVEITSPEHAASVRTRLRMVRDACDTIEHALKEWVTAHGPIDVAPGVLYGAVQHEGKERVEITVPGAVAVVRRHLGEAADEALEVSSSKAALERGARRVLRERGGEGRGALRAIVGPLLDELREIGALKQGAPYTTVEEFTRRTTT